VPAEVTSELMRMVACGLRVAAAAVPVGLIAWRVARRSGEPVLPRPKPWRVPWTGFEVFVAFFLLNALVPLILSSALIQSGFYQQVYGPGFYTVAEASGPSFESQAAVLGGAAAIAIAEQQAEAAAVRGLWVGLVSLPVQVGILLLGLRLLWPRRHLGESWHTIPARVVLAVIAWAVLTPIVLLVHTAVNLIFAELGWAATEHPLSRLSGSRPTLDQILFVLQAAVAAPLVEELLFRGSLLGWLVGGRSMFDRVPGTSHRPPADRRVWPVLVIGVVMAVAMSREGFSMLTPTRGAVIFAVVLLVGWIGLRQLTRKKRTLGAVYASAALFAVVHSEVWPTPLPLFILGLGLGWLAVRTRGVLAPAIVHGLFNAVSVLFVLRSGPM
jgi:membrane protease YdiL (CAAX protease family)